MSHCSNLTLSIPVEFQALLNDMLSKAPYLVLSLGEYERNFNIFVVDCAALCCRITGRTPMRVYKVMRVKYENAMTRNFECGYRYRAGVLVSILIHNLASLEPDHQAGVTPAS